ncbi:UDP-N-acetylglucosamine 4,6-dehydratase family protein [Dysgonomonas sp. 511]|uniref:UDP-N-acetylglucosamine 4,6-dehydratase family protein n=1 Tax=Dysgonomonas sp. 511 TaxID=2302930 RepID=UPI0021027430|nr:nucleoside-diphosphate sugar epimerase/dehydratase [Dysgonomonas sp. 511]
MGTIQHPDFVTYFIIAFSYSLVFFLLLRTFQGIVRYSTIHEIKRLFLASIATNAFIFTTLHFALGMAGSVTLAYCCAFFFLSFTGLFLFRIVVISIFQRLVSAFATHQPTPVYVWSADEQDVSLEQMTNAPGSRFTIKGFILKEYSPNFRQLTNLPILIINDIEDIAKYNIKNILFTDRDILKRDANYIEKLLAKNIRIYIVPLRNLSRIKSVDDATHQEIRPLQIEDLLSRPEIKISMDSIGECVNGKTVMVTGAAGSIGSEIVRQLANFSPKCVICLDQAETPLNDLNIELEKKYPHLNFIAVIADIRNKNKLSKVFHNVSPDIVYHAAAYKHVPMMEKCPCEAIITNVKGTKNVADLSIEHSVEMFVMVSTDKAVNPTNIMGASKRIAEIYTQSAAIDKNKNKSNTKFVTTRFGNVLGSNGSVIPLFRKQIESGGPLTVTHADITRYFMTIPEACRLVLEASHIGNSGHIYVFDMGEPVKILDMAKKMIKLAGLEPEKDIEIKFSGLRPGEKLYEELLNDSETTIPTSHEKVMIAKVREYKFSEIEPIIDEMIGYAREEDIIRLVSLMKTLVPEYVSQNSQYEILDKDRHLLTVVSPNLN